MDLLEAMKDLTKPGQHLLPFRAGKKSSACLASEVRGVRHLEEEL